jgi:hypothetical protein
LRPVYFCGEGKVDRIKMVRLCFEKG